MPIRLEGRTRAVAGGGSAVAKPRKRRQGAHEARRTPEEGGAGRAGRAQQRAYTSCSSEPFFFRTFFSPASMGTAKRFCFGGIGQLKL